MAMIAVVYRVLPQLDNTQTRPVTTAVIQESDYAVDSMESYLFDEAKTRIRRFKERFVEFRNAEWYIDIIDMNDMSIIDSENIKGN